MAKTMVITGASRGLGAAIARGAAREGYNVAINYLNSAREADALRKEVSAAGVDAIAVQADVSTANGVERLFAEVDCHFGALDVLIANSGIAGPLLAIEQLDEAAFGTVIAANVNSLVFSTREAVRRMSRKHGGAGGSIVVMSSVAARLGGRPGMLAYTVSKGAADAFTLAMARELAGTGIRINALRPGMIDTSIHDVYGGTAALAKFADAIPLGRVGEPHEVAEAALFLASDKASYIHGAILDVGGGR
ncbi:SDR family oxidoreductase [Sphingomonas koreensis]|nr:SDR family oxidoreductase [Sphingomonas koreensis]